MFDWNDEELTNILWGEAGESDDHIVPFQEGAGDYHKKKEWSQEGTSTTNKPSEKRTPETTYDFPGSKSDDNNPSLKKDDCGKSTYGFTSGSWPEFSSSNAAQIDPNVERAELDKGRENFQNSLDDKEQGDFDDYSWANIGSFDDLDRILSNDDPIFGPGSLENADELWSSKDLANNFELGASRDDTCRNFDIKTEYEQPDDPPFVPNYEKMNLPDQVEEYRGGRNKPSAKEKACLVTGGKATMFNSQVAAEKAATPYQLADKAGGQKKPLKGRKKTLQKSETKSPQDFYSVWNPYGQYEMVQFPSSSSGLQYHQIPSPFIAHPAYVNLANPYPMMPMISHIPPPVLSGYEVSPMNKSMDNTRAKTLTPQEKIEKLRRRQQMRALLAIKKQQQQFGHQANHQENQIQSVEGSGLTGEDLSVLSLFDPNSPLEQDDSNTLSVGIDDYSAEESVLHQLQNIISKLDIRTRLCIRNSLFRLAQSALKRNYLTDRKSDGNEQEIIGQKESDGDDRCPKLPDAETKTNSIDRIVAHLLFRRPMDSPVKNPDTPPDSPLTEQETGSLMNSPNIDINLENATNYGPGSGGAVE